MLFLFIRGRVLPSKSAVSFALAIALLELIHHTLKIRIASAKTSGEPVSAAFHYSLAIGQHFKLAGFARRHHGVNTQPLFNQGHETRDLGFVVFSRGAGTYLNFHSVLQSLYYGCFPDQRYL